MDMVGRRVVERGGEKEVEWRKEGTARDGGAIDFLLQGRGQQEMKEVRGDNGTMK